MQCQILKKWGGFWISDDEADGIRSDPAWECRAEKGDFARYFILCTTNILIVSRISCVYIISFAILIWNGQDAQEVFMRALEFSTV